MKIIVVDKYESVTYNLDKMDYFKTFVWSNCNNFDEDENNITNGWANDKYSQSISIEIPEKRYGIVTQSNSCEVLEKIINAILMSISRGENIIVFSEYNCTDVRFETIYDSDGKVVGHKMIPNKD